MTNKKLTRARAIKEYCKNSCCAGSLIDWKECPTISCYLWRFRLGREVLGNQTSYRRKHRVLPKNFEKNEVLQRGSEVEENEN